ncbi:hypothetical protein FJZ18_04580 [Candidatus Pacearchaeota archaeon]|nr:hypothetical protein [Candidatus Pacearchaeota archaeon]
MDIPPQEKRTSTLNIIIGIILLIGALYFASMAIRFISSGMANGIRLLYTIADIVAAVLAIAFSVHFFRVPSTGEVNSGQYKEVNKVTSNKARLLILCQGT